MVNLTADPKTLSANMEMYLKTILELDEDGEGVGVKSISKTLKVTMPSVSQALQLLKQRGMVSHQRYGRVRLTKAGLQVATAVKQRFNVLEQFLVEVLRIDQEVAAREACEIEHVLKRDTMLRLKAFLAFITGCRMEINSVIDHFHDYLEHYLEGQPCPDCELAGHSGHQDRE